MNRQVRLRFSVLVLLTALLATAWTAPAYADEESLPPDAPAEPAADSSGEITDGETSAEAAVSSESAPTISDPIEAADPAPPEAAPADKAAATDELAEQSDATEVVPVVATAGDALVEETAPNEIAAAEEPLALLEQLPEGTELAVTDASGESLPLATEEAAEIVATGDPMWCPAGVTPMENKGGCSANYDNLSLLVSEFTPTLAVNGVIWIQGGAPLVADAATISISDSNWALASNYSLTFNGGWTGSGNGIDINNPSLIKVPLIISNWDADLTLNNIVFTEGPVVTSVALDIRYSEKVRLTRVRVEKSDGEGAFIQTGGDVIIRASEFSDNIGSGLLVQATGAISLTDVEAIGNGVEGARLDNCLEAGGACLASKNVTLSGTNVFSANLQNGLVVNSGGAITVGNVIADFNGDWGADLDNTSAPTPKAIVLNGTHQFNYNDTGGLWVQASGAITASNLRAIGNLGGPGAHLLNANVAPLTVNGTNSFFDNSGDGLGVSGFGTITVNNITAIENGGFGVFLTNSTTGAVGGLTLTGYGTFFGNGLDGLGAYSRGAITLANLTANGNGTAHDDPTDGNSYGYGAKLSNDFDLAKPANVTLTGVNTFSDNWLNGLDIHTYGSILTNNLTANANGGGGYVQYGYGVNLYNAASSTPRLVTVAGTNEFNDNADSGLSIQGSGAISTKNLTAVGNHAFGVQLDNGSLGSVSVNGTNTVLNNLCDGLLVQSLSRITVSNITATGNSFAGAYLNNAYPGATGGVTILGYAVANTNGLDGLELYSNGAVVLANVTAMTNGWQHDDPAADGNAYGYGAMIQNGSASVAAANVTLTGVNTFNYNWLTGLQVDTYGNILTNNLTAIENGQGNFPSYGYGAWLDNCGYDTVLHDCTDATLPRSITMAVSSNFSGNHDNGLWATSLGAITITKIRSNDNEHGGAYLKNMWNQAVPANLTIAGYGEFSGNSGWLGLEASSHGTIAIANLAASNNWYGNVAGLLTGGAYLWVYRPGTALSNITLTGTNVFESNGDAAGNNGVGLYADADGTISIANLRASSNAKGGAWLLADTGVRLTGTNWFNYNGYDGLRIVTDGAVTLYNVSADGNRISVGVSVDNRPPSATTTPPNVTILGAAHFNINWQDGLYISTYGAVTLGNVTANGNGQSHSSGCGVFIDNAGGIVARPVTLSGTNTFMENHEAGLEITSQGAVTLSNVAAEFNGRGVSVGNLAAVPPLAPGNVTINGTNRISHNETDGLVVDSYGAITVNNLTANWNGNAATLQGTGATLDNCQFLGMSCQAAVPRNITLTGLNSFVGNYEIGLYFDASGAASLQGAGVHGNFWDGTAAPDPGASGLLGFAAGNITLTCVNTSGNGNDTWGTRGYYLDAGGILALTGVTDVGNLYESYPADAIVVAKACPLP